MTWPDPMCQETNPKDAFNDSRSHYPDDQDEVERNPSRTSSDQNNEFDITDKDDDSRKNDSEQMDEKSSQRQPNNSEIMYSFESFRAIVSPVSITMILSALAVVFFNTEETLAAGEQAYANTYQIVDLQDGNNAQNLGASLLNTMVIISIICFMTFVIVLLYKYRCLKIFYGYMVVVTALLLGYFTSNMFIVAIEIYGWKVDKLSFAFVMYNYAAVGTLAIFYQRGVPRWITQGYLITSSVCLAWQFSYLNDWMAWTLLVMLALYDLFAVLSPCGPLKALAKLISKPGAPQLPGLLYEASLPSGVQKPNRKQRHNDAPAENSVDNNHPAEETKQEEDPEGPDGRVSDSTNEHLRITTSGKISVETKRPHESDDKGADEIHQLSGFNTGHDHSHYSNGRSKICTDTELLQSSRSGQREHNVGGITVKLPEHVDTSNCGSIPLALAKLYNLNILDLKGVLRQRRFSNKRKHFYSSAEVREGSWSQKQLRSEVTAIFPPRGGIISKAEEQKYDTGATFVVHNSSGVEMRKFVVTREGKVMQVMRRGPREERTDIDQDELSTIKLGIGDFVFYSVLVSKAAQYSFTTFVTCFFVVLFGLAGTLVILALKGKALPALPISIGLGVLFFLITKELVQPWIHATLRYNLYV
ncbi:presenilin [Nitzschia inconspicua]|uniref:Presenilin n=1 Tax=Nitzschia inconspicua TaxID=303405 RepID=A0A9K3PCW3_9STRA|nr:presenilin [Nitzschia inconspicua]